MVTGMTSPGIDLRPALEQDQLRIISLLPEAWGAEEHLIHALDAIEAFGPQHVVVDAVSATARMGSDKVAFDYLVRLTNGCRERGITCVFTNRLKLSEEESDISGLGISSIVDTVLVLRFVREGGEVNRTLLVVKSRGGRHSNEFREYLITDRGIELAAMYAGEGDVVTGRARRERDGRAAAQLRRRSLALAQKESEVQQRQSALQAQLVLFQQELQRVQGELESLRLEDEIDRESRQVLCDLAEGAPPGPPPPPIGQISDTDDRDEKLGEGEK